ncbi:MAG: hypothetical protein ACYDAY_01350 [Candidatus Dormibacteria bacterium]
MLAGWDGARPEPGQPVFTAEGIRAGEIHRLIVDPSHQPLGLLLTEDLAFAWGGGPPAGTLLARDLFVAATAIAAVTRDRVQLNRDASVVRDALPWLATHFGPVGSDHDVPGAIIPWTPVRQPAARTNPLPSTALGREAAVEGRRFGVVTREVRAAGSLIGVVLATGHAPVMVQSRFLEEAGEAGEAGEAVTILIGARDLAALGFQ